MTLLLINDTSLRVQFRLRQQAGLSGSFTLDKGGRYQQKVDEQYRVRVFNSAPDARYDLLLDVLNGPTLRLFAFRRNDDQSPLFEVVQEPPLQPHQLRCENSTLLPLCFQVERLRPQLEGLLQLPPQHSGSLGLADEYELEAVIGGCMSNRLSLKTLNCTVTAFHDKETGKTGLRST
jgi:hypothetical protein